MPLTDSELFSHAADVADAAVVATSATDDLVFSDAPDTPTTTGRD
ncbi:hypothetical protein AAFP30_19465 [Gordonia sp. CPCC 205515]